MRNSLPAGTEVRVEAPALTIVQRCHKFMGVFSVTLALHGTSMSEILHGDLDDSSAPAYILKPFRWKHRKFGPWADLFDRLGAYGSARRGFCERVDPLCGDALRS